MMGPLKALHRRQLQLAGDRVVLVHEVCFALEPALADLCDAPRTTQAGAETKFVELWAGWRVFIVCSFAGVTSLMMTSGSRTLSRVTSSRSSKSAVLRDLVWWFHPSHDGTSMTLYSEVVVDPCVRPNST